MKNPSLSIVILSYNTKDLLISCLRLLAQVKDEVNFEVIVVDNGSSDGSVRAIRNFQFSFFNFQIIENKMNLGFAGGNNLARDYCRGKYVLFLNSDTLVKPETLKETVKYLEDNPMVGIVTCKQIMLNGNVDPDSRRSFPTPWIAFTHFTFLDRIFPRSKLFSRYWYGYRSPDEAHEIDVSQGAFLLTQKKILNEVNWFSGEYFLDGEDIDLSWKVKEKGYKIVYFPRVSIIHIKKASKKKARSISVGTGVNSMEIFYRKFFWKRYPVIVNLIVIVGIRFIKLVRAVRKLVWI